MNKSLQATRSVLRQKMHVADPIADAVVEAIAHHDHEECELTVMNAVELLLRSPRFDTALVAQLCSNDPHIEAAFTKFLVATNSLPSRHSDDDIKEGNRLFEQNAVFGFVGLGCTSLPECYCWSIEAEVLGITHGMGKNIDRRIPETATYVLDVMSDRAILEPGHSHAVAPAAVEEDNTPRGVRAIQKIRLLHSLLRWLIKFDPKGAGSVFDGPLKDSPFTLMLQAKWPVGEKGEPISQAFLAGTLLTFSLTVINSMRKMLVPVSADHARLYLHRWKVIGFKMGIEPELLEYFDSEPAANQLHAAMMAEFRGPTDPGKLMAHTLENYMNKNIVKRVPLHKLLRLHHMPRVAMWHLAGKETCRVLDLEPGLFGKTVGWLGWQGIRMIGFMKRVPLLRRFSHSVFEWLSRVMWGWRHQDDPELAAAMQPQHHAAAPGAKAAPSPRPRTRTVVVGRELADLWGVPKSKLKKKAAPASGE